MQTMNSTQSVTDKLSEPTSLAPGKSRRFWYVGGLLVVIAVSVAAILLYTRLRIPELKQLIAAVKPAVVQVKSWGDQGSGVVINTNGYVVTNAHVVEDSSNITVSVWDAKNGLQDVSAELVGISVCDDIALLKLPAREQPYSSIPYSSTISLNAGDEVIALGYPMNTGMLDAVEPSATTNTISRTNMRLKGITQLIEHQAAINPGSSGGPLLDRRGNLVGINTLSVANAQSLFYAIDSRYAIPVWERLMKGQPPSNLPTLAPDAPVNGTLEAVSERQCYTFEALAGQTVQLETVRQQPLDPALMLYGPDNHLIAANDDIAAGGENVNARIEWVVEQDGVYQVVIRSGGLGPAGLYSLGLTIVTPVQPDGAEATPDAAA